MDDERDDLTFDVPTTADVDEILTLERRIFFAPWRREFFVSEVNASGHFNLVARRGAAIIGYLFAMWFLDEMHVNKIAVAEHERRQGVALALMRRADAFARRHGIHTISLEVRESNAEARGFYERIDFEAAYRRARYYPDGEAAVIMVRRI